jgi:hypothetical protein
MFFCQEENCGGELTRLSEKCKFHLINLKNEIPYYRCLTPFSISHVSW